MMTLTINNLEIQTSDEMSIYTLSEILGITIPCLNIKENDICLVEVTSSKALVNAKETMIEDDMEIITNSKRLYRARRRIIEKLNKEYKPHCDSCLVKNCQFKKYSLKHHLQIDYNHESNKCLYFINGVKNETLDLIEIHHTLLNDLHNKSLHKLAIVTSDLLEYKQDILSHGFNEVINLNLARKIKMLEEIDYCLQDIARKMDKKTNHLPLIVSEKEIPLLKDKYINHYVNIGSEISILERLFRKVNFTNLLPIYISNNYKYNSEIENVTIDYLNNLSLIDNKEIKNISKNLNIQEEMLVSYNSFIPTLIDIMKSKQTFTENIDTISEFVINKNKKEIKIKIIKDIKLLDELINEASYDIILLLNNVKHPMSLSFIDDEDINYIYKEYLKKPNNI